MKRTYSLLLSAFALSFAVLTACSDKPVDEPVNPTPEPTPDVPEYVALSYNVKAYIGDESTRATLNDGEAIKWAETDKVTAWYLGADNSFSYAMREDATATAVEGSLAEFSFKAMPQGGKAWIAFGSNTGYDGCSARKVEFNYTSAQTQAAAGVMNTEYLRLVSDVIEVPVVEEGTTSIDLEVNLDIVGSVLRFIPYSKTGLYAAESVKSVELVSTDNALAGGGSAVARNYAEYNDTELGYKWWANDAGTSFSDECTIFWDATSKSITTTLSTPLSLEGITSADTPGNGIYMTVPAVKVGGYKYVVTTDAARYTFDASTTELQFSDNTLRNVILNLESDKATRLELSSVKGDLQYIGDLNAASQKLSYEGVTDKDGGYWYAQTRDTGADWVTREGAQYTQFYTGVTFEAIDNATGEVAEWLEVKYRDDGNTHWFITADAQAEGGAERSATVTATFPDVDGYFVTEACRTKVVTVTQAAYSTVKVLGFGGGIGDQTLDGDGVTALSLGWCAISVNGAYAEDWATDKNNEQELYGSVVIECREGAANGPIVDWLTVEYGKDGEGKHNSTHLFATATKNDTGAERKALVCCTYNAPEGYEFEGGAKSFFRQFFVTQGVAGSIKVIEFWGGIGASFTYESQAYTAKGMSYWVAKVAGSDATDWNGDSHNEQAIYGGAEFKCYDYSTGTRGAEVDWIKVAYKQENGKVIDTWWLADIEENTTGVQRVAEVVCTFPTLEGYEYKDGQNVRTTIVYQNPAAGGNEGGDDNTGDNTGDDNTGDGEEVYAYNLEPIQAWGSGWGFPANTVHEGNYAFIRNTTLNGNTIYFDGANAPANAGEVAAKVVAMAFKSSAPSDEEKAAFNMQGKTASATAITARARWYGGVQIDVAFTTTDANSITKVTGYDGEGNELGYWIIWTD